MPDKSAASRKAFRKSSPESEYTCYACAIMPEHVHLIIRKHRDRAEQMAAYVHRASRLRLCSTASVPEDHPIWTEHPWKRFLLSPSAVRNCIRYVQNNPAKSGLRPQDWSFVQPYDNWPFHKHSAGDVLAV